MLPRLDGWDVLARAKADPSIADIPIVVVSMLDERGKGFSLGAADYLIKPVQRESLVATLRRLTFAANGANGRPRVLAIDDEFCSHALVDQTDGSRVGVIKAEADWPAEQVRRYLKQG